MRIFGQRPVRQSLLIAQLHAAQVQHAILHRDVHLLATPGGVALIQCGDDAKCKMQSGAGIADLRAGDQGRSVVEASGRGRAASALRDVLVHLAVFVWSRAKTLDRGKDHARVQRLDVRPGEAHAIQRTRREVLHHDVAGLHQRLKHRLAMRIAPVDRDRTFVMVQHGEIQAVHLGDILQLATCDVANPWAFDLDHVGAKPGEKLSACRARLHVGEVQNANAVECLHLMLPPSSSGRCSG